MSFIETHDVDVRAPHPALTSRGDPAAGSQPSADIFAAEPARMLTATAIPAV